MLPAGRRPANLRLEAFIPFTELLPKVDLLVTNGGYGGVQTALAAGVPLVVAGRSEDKMEVSARVAWSGAGISLANTESAHTRNGAHTRRAHNRLVSSRPASLACLALACSAVLATPAAAAGGPQVPAFTLKRIQAKAGDAAYLPTRLPFGYRYERWQLPTGGLVVTFKHRQGADRFTFQVERLPSGTHCDLGGAFHKTLQMDGNKVYYRGEKGEWIAWRCVTSPRTAKRYVLSVHSRGPLPDVALARVAASGKRAARS